MHEPLGFDLLTTHHSLVPAVSLVCCVVGPWADHSMSQRLLARGKRTQDRIAWTSEHTCEDTDTLPVAHVTDVLCAGGVRRVTVDQRAGWGVPVWCKLTSTAIVRLLLL